MWQMQRSKSIPQGENGTSSECIFPMCILLRWLQFLSKSPKDTSWSYTCSQILIDSDVAEDWSYVFIIYIGWHERKRFFTFWFQNDSGFYFLKLEIILMLDFVFKFCLSRRPKMLRVIEASREKTADKKKKNFKYFLYDLFAGKINLKKRTFCIVWRILKSFKVVALQFHWVNSISSFNITS